MKINNILSIAAAVMLTASLTSCIHDEEPVTTVSDKQVATMSDTQLSMLYGISSYMVAYNSWGSSDYYLNDWGYPCQMFYREINGEDFPIYKSTYDYWSYHENGTYASSYTVYTWYYYYKLIKNCNNLIGAIDANTTDANSRHYLGAALAFRAMAYLDLARSFEFKPTGFTELDAKATDILGLTVPIVTEKTTAQEQINNPRVDFCTMYRFIMQDLTNARQYISGYTRTDKSLPDSTCVYGLMARLYMEIGSRFDPEVETNCSYEKYEKELTTDSIPYMPITANCPDSCYKKAILYADSAKANYSPMTEDEWHDAKTGFNTANESWMWRCRIGGKEQEPAYYCSFLGQICSEALSALPYAYSAYRCIGSYLYDKISVDDWRRDTWISPKDAGKATDETFNNYKEKYKSNFTSAKEFNNLPKYANLKFRPGEGNIDDYATWMISDLPLMRMEEMFFIKAEAEARLNGSSAGIKVLQELNNYRYAEDGDGYDPEVSDLQDFIDEMMIQKRIEFWGEGICFFDYKRLNLQVDRSNSTNVEDAFKLVSNRGYCCPWMNYFIPQLEIQRNEACKANPDVSGTYTK